MPDLSRPVAVWPIHRVTSFEILGPYELDITFSDRSKRLIDFRPLLHGEWFGKLQDAAAFNAVVIDAHAGGLRWANGANVDADTLHGWPTAGAQLAARIQNYERFERRSFAWNMWLTGGIALLFAYNLAVWAGVAGDPDSFRPLASLLLTASMLLLNLASLLMRRSAALAFSAMAAAIVLLGFSLNQYVGGR